MDDEQRFRDVMKDIKDYCATLSADECKAAEVDPSVDVAFEDIVDAKLMLEVTTNTVAKYRRRKELFDKNLTVPKLLGRYLRLPKLWRMYVRAVTIEWTDNMGDRTTSTDHDAICTLGIECVRADGDDDDDSSDGIALAEMLKKFDKALTLAESEK